jgi:hypothetical protein
MGSLMHVHKSFHFDNHDTVAMTKGIDRAAGVGSRKSSEGETEASIAYFNLSQLRSANARIELEEPSRESSSSYGMRG